MLNGNLCAVDIVAESGDIFGDKEDEEEAKDDPIGRHSVFSSVG
jgi:hypothetical protein